MINMWHEHGTKIMGSLIALLGVIGALDPETLRLIFGERGPGIAAIVGGLLVIMRGIQGTIAINKVKEDK